LRNTAVSDHSRTWLSLRGPQRKRPLPHSATKVGRRLSCLRLIESTRRYNASSFRYSIQPCVFGDFGRRSRNFTNRISCDAQCRSCPQALRICAASNTKKVRDCLQSRSLDNYGPHGEIKSHRPLGVSSALTARGQQSDEARNAINRCHMAALTALAKARPVLGVEWNGRCKSVLKERPWRFRP
jgi:hypothetical protein